MVPAPHDGEPAADPPPASGGARWRRGLLAVFVVLSVGLLVPDAVRVLTGRETDPGQIASVAFPALVLLVLGISLTVMAIKRRRAPGDDDPPS